VGASDTYFEREERERRRERERERDRAAIIRVRCEIGTFETKQ
jgi:hypothetical protein